MRLIIVRHGETDSNVAKLLDTGHPGATLNDTGLAQAAALVDTLGDEKIEAVYTSDLTRAEQTGRPLADALGVPLTTMPELREIYAGIDDMAPDWAPYVAVLAAWGENPEGRIEGGDDANTFLERFDRGVAKIIEAGHEVAVIVSHGAAIRVWVPLRAENVEAGAAARWRLENTDVVVLDGDGSSWRLVAWADQVF